MGAKILGVIELNSLTNLLQQANCAHSAMPCSSLVFSEAGATMNEKIIYK